MYQMVRFLSFFIRNFCSPNPFESLQEQTIVIQGIEIPLNPEIINYIAELALFPLTFTVVGLYYKKSDKKPVKGSLLYLLFYLFHVYLLQRVVIGGFTSTVFAETIAIAVAAYIFVGIVNHLVNKRKAIFR